MKNLKNGCIRTEVFISPKNYKELRSKEDLKKKWFVQCVFHDLLFESKYPKGFQYRMKINVFDNILERKKAVEATKEEMIKGLDFHNFNPITKQYMVSDSEELRPDLVLYEALKISQKTISASPHHLKQIRCAVNRMQKFIEVLRYDYIFIKDIKIWHIKNLLKKMKLTPSVYNKFRHYLMTLFKELIQFGCIDHNPVRDITKKIESAKIRQVLTDEKLKYVLKYLQVNHYEFFRYTKIFHLSGARSAELLRVQRKHVDLENQEYVVLPKEITKNNKIGRVPITDDLKNDLLSLNIENPDYYIFGIESPYCRRKEKLFLPSPHQISKNVAGNLWRENVRDILGIDKKMYWFKHKGANDKEDVGISLDVVKEIFRHGSEKVTEIYATKHQERVFEKARKMIPDFK